MKNNNVLLIASLFLSLTSFAQSGKLVKLKSGNLIIADRNLGAVANGVALNYTSDIKHPDHKNVGFKGGYYTWKEAQKACPNGWRLPTEKEVRDIGREGNNMQYSNDMSYLYYADNSKCYFPLSGRFKDPSDSDGFYWTSSDMNPWCAVVMRVNTYNCHHDFHMKENSDKFSVRCVKTP